MTIEIKVPARGASITEATVGQRFKKPGDAGKVDEPLVELETEKVTVEVPAPAAGVLADIKVAQGTTVGIGSVLGSISEGAAAAAQPAAPQPAAAPPPPKAPEAAPPKPAPAAAVASTGNGGMPPSPAARRVMEERGLAEADVQGSGRRGQILQEDALAASAGAAAQPAVSRPAEAPPTRAPLATPPVPVTQLRAPSAPNDAAREERVRMTRLRQTIARRLKESQNTAAQLTTFNEVDMSHVMALRAEYKESFEKKHGVRLGFMGFFVKACIAALKELPDINGEIEGDDVIYKNYYDIGVAVSTDRGLVVPVVRDADKLSLAQIEAKIHDYGLRARDNKLKLDELMGGTFTITNGGVFGSLMSTPILNTPQSGILGMHKIQPRPVAEGDKIVIKPMMYLALSYDHRLVDGRAAVTFLVRVKENLEDPQRLLLDI